MTVDWLKFSDPQAGVVSVAVAIGPLGHGSQHTGILHRRKNKPVEFLNLRWHNQLENGKPDPECAWVRFGLPPARALHVAARCRRVARRNTRGLVPYAVRYSNTSFKRTGDLLLGETEYGLTCATFVLAVLSSVGIILLDLESWKPRNDDAEFHDNVITLLEDDLAKARRKADFFRLLSNDADATKYDRRADELETHILHVKSQNGCTRFRPAEVAGASASREIPLSFSDAVAKAMEIDGALEEKKAESHNT